jgi:putative transcriptional regulator
MAREPLAGKLLVATPVMRDPNFDHTVVLLLDHNADGALGVVLNRPSAADVAGPLPQWVERAAPPAVVFVGGPVAPGSAICLARAAEPSRSPGRDETPAGDEGGGWQPLFGGLGTVDLGRRPDEVDASVEAVRVFAGYAGWGAGQLESEIEAGAWFVLPTEPGDALGDEPAGLWRRVLRRQGGVVAAMATFPAELSAN